MPKRVCSLGLLPLIAPLLLSMAEAGTAKNHVVETKHYTISTDVSQEFAEEIADTMETVYAAYERVFRKIKGGVSQRMAVRVTKTREEYLKLVGPDQANTGGIFMPGRNMLATFLEGQGKSTLHEVLYHEGFHQFMAARIGACPIWLNEGLATLFQHSVKEGKSLDPKGVPPGKLRLVQKAMAEGKGFTLRDLVLMGHAEWQRNMASDITVGALEYFQSWLLVHFLAFAEGGRYQSNLNNYIMLVKGGAEATDALSKAFGTNLGAMEKAWRKYIEKLEPTPILVCKENMTKLAMLAALYVKAQKKPIESMESLYADVSKQAVKFEIPIAKDMTMKSSDVGMLQGLFRCPCDKGKEPISYEIATERTVEGPYPEFLCRGHGKTVLRALWYVDTADGKRYPDVVEEDSTPTKDGKGRP